MSFIPSSSSTYIFTQSILFLCIPSSISWISNKTLSGTFLESYFTSYPFQKRFMYSDTKIMCAKACTVKPAKLWPYIVFSYRIFQELFSRLIMVFKLYPGSRFFNIIPCLLSYFEYLTSILYHVCYHTLSIYHNGS